MNYGSICTFIATTELVSERRPARLLALAECAVWAAVGYIALDALPTMGEVVSRTELVEHMYDQDFDRDSNTIEVFVGRLRKKMGVDLIETVRGLGYRIQAPKHAN